MEEWTVPAWQACAAPPPPLPPHAHICFCYLQQTFHLTLVVITLNLTLITLSSFIFTHHAFFLYLHSLSGAMFGAVTLGRNILVTGGCQGATNTKVGGL